MKRLLLALMLFASPLRAATIWLAPAASGDSSGTDSLNAHTVGWANANCTSGTWFRMKSGTYNASINPTSSPGSQVRFTGFTQSPSAAHVNDIAISKDNITARWIGSSALSGFNQSTNDSLVKIAASAVSQFLISSHGSIADSLTPSGTITGTGQNHFISFSGSRSGEVLDTVVCHCVVVRGGWDYGSLNNRLTNSTVNLTVNTTSGQGDTHCILISAANANVIYGNTFNFTVTACHGFFFGLEMYEAYNTQVQGNAWNFTLNGDIGGSHGIWSMRDSSSWNRYWQNTVNVSGSGVPTGISIMWTNGGSWSDGRRQNYCGYNVVKNACAPTASGAFWMYDGGKVDTLEYNVIAAKPGPCFYAQNTPDSLVVQNNTLYGVGLQCIGMKGNNPTNSHLRRNIVVARPGKYQTYRLSTDGACIYVDQAAAFGCDSNYYAPSILARVGSDPYWPEYTLSGWRLETGNDLNSAAAAFSGDMFLDARWGTLNLRPARTASASPFYISPSRWYGAYQP